MGGKIEKIIPVDFQGPKCLTSLINANFGPATQNKCPKNTDTTFFEITQQVYKLYLSTTEFNYKQKSRKRESILYQKNISWPWPKKIPKLQKGALLSFLEREWHWLYTHKCRPLLLFPGGILVIIYPGGICHTKSMYVFHLRSNK